MLKTGTQGTKTALLVDIRYRCREDVGRLMLTISGHYLQLLLDLKASCYMSGYLYFSVVFFL